MKKKSNKGKKFAFDRGRKLVIGWSDAGWKGCLFFKVKKNHPMEKKINHFSLTLCLGIV
jgi:hypothetical protein